MNSHCNSGAQGVLQVIASAPPKHEVSNDQQSHHEAKKWQKVGWHRGVSPKTRKGIRASCYCAGKSEKN